jgi:hypothetical protein
MSVKLIPVEKRTVSWPVVVEPKGPTLEDAKGVIHTPDGPDLPEAEVRAHIKAESPEGVPPAESSRRPEFTIFWTLLIGGSIAVIAGLYFALGAMAAAAGGIMLLFYALVGGASRYLTDTFREKERHQAMAEVRSEHAGDPQPPNVETIHMEPPLAVDDDD